MKILEKQRVEEAMENWTLYYTLHKNNLLT